MGYLFLYVNNFCVHEKYCGKEKNGPESENKNVDKDQLHGRSHLITNLRY
jgi:hypothetical protein